MPEIFLNCQGNELPVVVSTDGGKVEIGVSGRCSKLDDDNRCQVSREYCMLEVRGIYEDFDDGDEEIIDLDPEDI